MWGMKSKIMRWVGHVACMGSRRGTYTVWHRDLSERDHLEDLGIDGKITLKMIFKKRDGEALTALTGAQHRPDSRRMGTQ
jgi:hypothetical protein